MDLVACASRGDQAAFHSGWPSFSDNTHSITTEFVIGTSLMCLGALIRVVAYNYLGRHFTLFLMVNEGQKLVTNGPYAIVRHPSYTGAYTFMLGVTFAQFGRGSIYAQLGLWSNPLWFIVGAIQLTMMLTLFGFGVGSRMPKEDKVLQAHFRDEWDKWARRTPYKLMPYVY